MLQWFPTLEFSEDVIPNIHSSIVYNSQDTEATEVSISRWMDKEGVVRICTMEYYSAIKINEILLFAATWMDLEVIY